MWNVSSHQTQTPDTSVYKRNFSNRKSIDICGHSERIIVYYTMPLCESSFRTKKFEVNSEMSSTNQMHCSIHRKAYTIQWFVEICRIQNVPIRHVQLNLNVAHYTWYWKFRPFCTQVKSYNKWLKLWWKPFDKKYGTKTRMDGILHKQNQSII